MKKFLLILSFHIFVNESSFSQQTVGLFQHDLGSKDNGYVLFSPITYTKTYLINKCGKLMHSWTSTYRPGISSYLQNDGVLLRTGNTNNPSFNSGGRGGILQKLDWNSNVVWSYLISNTQQCQHHDAIPLSNGNVLAIIWVKKTSAEAIAAGRNPSLLGSELWTEKIVELQPTGSNTANIIWEWNVWDNLVQDYDPAKPNYGIITDHPELINLNFRGMGSITDPDWLHINAVDYNPEFNQVMVSVHDFNEVWIIDRDLGQNGKIVYRWGNPVAYNRGTISDQKLFAQHNPQWLQYGFNHSGDILVFNNGLGRPQGNYSSVDIIKPPVDKNGNYFLESGMPFEPDSAHWIYKDSVPANFYAMNISGAQELEKGNFLICNGPSGTFFEIDSLKRKVWKYVNPVNTTGPMIQGTIPVQNTVFKCTFYKTDFSGFNGHVLTAGAPIEINPINYSCDLFTGIQNITESIDFNLYQNYPNPFNPETNIKFSVKKSGEVSLKVYDVSGKEIADLVKEKLIAGSYVVKFDAHIAKQGSFLASGIYYYTLRAEDFYQTRKMILLK